MVKTLLVGYYQKLVNLSFYHKLVLVYLPTQISILSLGYLTREFGEAASFFIFLPTIIASLLLGFSAAIFVAFCLLVIDVYFLYSYVPYNSYLLSSVISFSFSAFAALLISLSKNSTQRENLLKEREIEFETSINSLSVGFIVLDPKLNVVNINSSAKRLLCFAESGSTKSGIFLDPLAVKLECKLDDIERQLEGSFKIREQLKASISQVKPIDNEFAFRDLFLHILISPIVTLDGDKIRIVGAVALIEDITQKKILERSRDEFFSIASHELRTPLTSIRGNTSLIKDYYQKILAKDKNLNEMVDDIYSSSVRLIEIVNDFLDTSRLEQGRMKFEIKDFEAETFVEDVMKELKPISQERSIYLKMTQTDPKLKVKADRDKAKQVLVNLVGNSLKFTDKGGVTIALSEGNGGVVKFSVTDTGKGIEEANQKLLFRKFQQAGSNILTRDATRGTGLGLYISKLIVEGMGGSIWLESSIPGKGSTFSFTLPRVS